MKARVAAVALLAAALSGCFTSTIKNIEQVKLTPAIIEEVGLPLYPGATPDRNGPLRITTEIKELRLQSLIVTLATHDPVDKVKAFYDSRLPQGSLLRHFHLGPYNSAQFLVRKTEKLSKMVTLTGLRQLTEIQLISAIASNVNPTAQKAK